jgi:hypothetical protein
MIELSMYRYCKEKCIINLLLFPILGRDIILSIKQEHEGSNIMDDRTKELIAIGVSVGVHCQP